LAETAELVNPDPEVLEILEKLVKVTLAFRGWVINNAGLNSSQQIELFAPAVFIAQLGGCKVFEIHFQRLHICFTRCVNELN
jgi:hypothetical protein